MSIGACRPRPVHAVSLRAAVYRQVRVSASPQLAADLANSSQEENARSAGRVTCALGAYLANRSITALVAGFWAAFSSGKMPPRSARLFWYPSDGPANCRNAGL